MHDPLASGRLAPEADAPEADAPEADAPEADAPEADAPYSRELLQGLLESSLDGIMVLKAVRENADDNEGEIVDFEWTLVNPVAAKALGGPDKNMIGRRLLEEFPALKEQGLFDDYARVVETGEPLRRDRVKGTRLRGWFRISAVRLGEHIAVTFHDTTALAKSNAGLRRRNRELNDFAHIASHDLQEPLRKVRAFAGLMREDYASEVDDTGRYYLERMEDGAERMARLVSDLLSLSRVTTQGHPFAQVDLNEIAAMVRTDLEMRIEETDGRVEIGDLPSLESDPTQMRQLLQNLIGNALKFHRDDVPPVVQVYGSCEAASEHPHVGVPDDAAEICRLVVEDNGTGFEEKFVNRIFTPLQRLHSRGEYEGTGIGLAVCRRIVERHGGHIEARSKPDVGSRFTILLPRQQPQHEEAPPEKALPQPGQSMSKPPGSR